MPCAPGIRSQAALLVPGFRLSPLWLSAALSLSAPCLKTASVFSTNVRFYLSYYSSITIQLRYRRVLLCGGSFSGSLGDHGAFGDCLRTRHLVRCTGKRRQANVEYALAGSCADLALTFIVLFLCLLSPQGFSRYSACPLSAAPNAVLFVLPYRHHIFLLVLANFVFIFCVSPCMTKTLVQSLRPSSIHKHAALRRNNRAKDCFPIRLLQRA